MQNHTSFAQQSDKDRAKKTRNVVAKANTNPIAGLVGLAQLRPSTQNNGDPGRGSPSASQKTMPSNPLESRRANWHTSTMRHRLSLPFLTATLGSALHFTASPCLAADFEWAFRAGGEGNDKIRGAAAGDNGSVYVTGEVSGNADFGGKALKSAGNLDFVVAKINARGKVLWASRAGGPQIDRGYGVSPTPDGGNSSSRIQDIFVAKFDRSGKLLWRRDGGGAADGLATSVAIDPRTGAVCIAGMFKATAKFGSREFATRGAHDFYMATFDKDGAFLAAHHGGGSETDYALGAAPLPNGGFAITGELSTAGEFNGRTHTCVGTRDATRATLDSSGAVTSFSLAGGTDHDLSYAIAGTTDNAIVISGAFRKQTRFGAHELTAKSGNDIFVAKARVRSGRNK